MLGFDARYGSCASDPELVRLSIEEKRILLARDRGLLIHSAVTHGYWLRETDSRRHVAEVVRRFDLARLLKPFTQCMACNESLRPVSKQEIRDRIPDRVAENHEEFRECPHCQRVYWQGPHHERMSRWVGELAESP